MVRVLVSALALSLALVGCEPPEPVVERIPPPPEDLSHWRVPTLVQPPKRLRPLPEVPTLKATPAEKVYDFQPGGTYQALVPVGFPLDVILEQGEELRALSGGDPEPVEQGQERKRWEVRQGKSGKDGTMQEHIFVQANEPGLKMGVILTTTRRTYYLTCESVKASPIRAVRWRYSDLVLDVAPDKAPAILPDPQDPRKYHVGYTVHSPAPAPAWLPRHIVDDGEKLFLVYPEITLFKTVPLVRKIGPSGPEVVNSRQYLNVVILDELPSRIELRLGAEKTAEVVTITQGLLRTIDCPGDPDCPVWPAAAQVLGGR